MHSRLFRAGILKLQQGKADKSLKAISQETEEIIFNVTEELLKKTGICAKEVSTPYQTLHSM